MMTAHRVWGDGGIRKKGTLDCIRVYIIHGEGRHLFCSDRLCLQRVGLSLKVEKQSSENKEIF